MKVQSVKNIKRFPKFLYFQMQILVIFLSFRISFIFQIYLRSFFCCECQALRVIKCNASFFYRLIFLTINCRNCKMEIGYHEFWIIQNYNCFFVNSYFALATVFVHIEYVEKCSCNLIFFIWKRFHFRTDFGQVFFVLWIWKLIRHFYLYWQKKSVSLYW